MPASDFTLKKVSISGPDGQVFESSALPDGLDEALQEFERLTGVDITDEDAIGGDTDKPDV
jgi:hypothetical protein